MSFSTRNNPKLAQSGVALTSLGAVGGARGTAAGGLRILVEFLTTYDPKAITDLEDDLEDLETKQSLIAREDEARQKRLAAVRKQIATVDANLKNRADAAVRKEIRLQDSLQGVRTKAGKAELAASQARLATLLKAQGFTKSEIDSITQRTALRAQEAILAKRVETAEEKAHQRAKQRVDTEAQLTKMQQVRANLVPKLTGLAIGAVGGIFGGAVLGVGFALAEKGLELVGDKVQDLIDPARHAKEAIDELGKSINEVASAKNITQIEAAREVLGRVGITGGTVDPGAGTDLSGILQQAAVQQQVNDALREYLKILDLKTNKEGVDKQQREDNIKTFRAEAQALGTFRSEVKITGFDLLGNAMTKVTESVVTATGEISLEEYAIRRAAEVTAEWENASYRAAQAQKVLAAAAESAAAIASIAAQQIASALSAAADRQSAAYGTKIDALGEGTSAKTRRLQKALDNASSGGGGDGGARQRELANIAEERALLLLKMRLRLLGTNINLEKFSGKFLLVAINAKITALQKEGREQEKINALLDLRYRQSQEIRRNEGEGVGDFLERRAQENRKLLAEEDSLRRQNQIDALNERKEVLEDEIALQELANRRRDALRKQDGASHNDALRKALEASKKADAKALADKKKALKAEQDAKEKAAKEALDLVKDSAIDETRAAIRGMDTIQELNIVGGRIAGYKRAKATIQALVDGFGLPPSVAAGLLAKINGLIRQFEAQRRDIFGGSAYTRRGGAAQPFATGGVIDLRNSTSVFGSNVRYGEEGSEIGVILSHNVAKILQQQKSGGVQQVGPFYLQGSDNPLRDRYAFGKMVEKSVEAALG